MMGQFDLQDLLNQMTPMVIMGKILKGSGRSEKEYNELLNQFDKTKKQVDQIAKQIKQGRIPNIPGMGGLGFN